jgi:hypothetical protein
MLGLGNGGKRERDKNKNSQKKTAHETNLLRQTGKCSRGKLIATSFWVFRSVVILSGALGREGPM